MEMTCGLAFGILLIGLFQAELAGCSWAKEAPRLQNSNMRVSFPLKDGQLKKLTSSLQIQPRKGFSSPHHSDPTRSLSNNRAANHDRRLPAKSFIQAHSPSVQSSGRIVKSFASKPKSQSTLSAQGSSRGLRDSYSFRPLQSGAHEASSHGRKGSPASLFGPVGPGPRSSVKIQTYAQGRARKVPSKASFSPQATAGKSYLNPQLALNVGGYGPRGRVSSLAAPRSSKAGASAPGYAPVEIHELPENLGGSAIRRLAQPTEQQKVPVPKPQQLYLQVHSPARTSIHPGSDWRSANQNQAPVQKPRQIPTPPPRWVPVYNPHPLSVHPASKWTTVKRPYSF